MNRINMRNEARRFIRIMFGTTCCALAYRCFLSPAGLFNGGFTGIAQIIRNVIQSLTGHTFHSDPTGIIVWCLNVPLMIYGYKELGRMFMIRTIFAITFQSLLMTLIPTPEKQLVTDAAVNCLAGGALNGFGIGTLLSQGGSSGGTDIVGLLGVKRRPEFSVGRISMFINICICIYAAITRDFEVAIYSLKVALSDEFPEAQTYLDESKAYDERKAAEREARKNGVTDTGAVPTDAPSDNAAGSDGPAPANKSEEERPATPEGSDAQNG